MITHLTNTGRGLLAAMLLITATALAQSAGYNYTRTYVYKEATQNTDAAKANAAVTYYDGLGRPIQKVAGKASASGKDVITHFAYDQYGRQPKSYLPFAGSGSALDFVLGAEAATQSFYAEPEYENTTNPYSEKKLEASPLNRVLEQAAPGEDWKMGGGHTIKFTYSVNAANEVKKLTSMATLNSTDGLYDASFTDNGHYAEADLYKVITTDENGQPMHEFKNRQGKLVLKRSFNVIADEQEERLDTYYVYDQYGNLSYVLPPLAEGAFDPNICYAYRYDRRNRLAEKKLPGKAGWEYIIYDALDRVVLTGPAYTPFGTPDAGWLHTYYDVFNRVCITGWLPGSFTAAALKNVRTQYDAVASVGTGNTMVDDVATGYNVAAIPSGFKVLTLNYYDSYNYPGAPAAPTVNTTVEGQNVAVNVKGMLTGTWDRVLTGPTETLAQSTYTYYDKKNRPVRLYSRNYMGGFTETVTRLDFDGTPQYSIVKHARVAGDAELATRHDFTYTAQDRLLTATHQIGANPAELMSHNTYNELGQLISKNVGGSDTSGIVGLQKVDYAYNIRGWLKEINNVEDLKESDNLRDLFAFKINYNQEVNDNINQAVKQLYNGNISEITWHTANDNIKRSYGYTYDRLNRMTDAWYQKPQSVDPQQNSYNEHVTYDMNGNIKTLNRNGDTDTPFTIIGIDQLEYEYDSNDRNRLIKVIDQSADPSGFKDSPNNNSDDYAYDDFGNMTTDLNKGIESIYYNHLNLPTMIEFHDDRGIISYLYTATGTKVRKIIDQERPEGMVSTVTDYLDGYQYLNAALQLFPTAEGYVDHTASSEELPYNYVYQYKDHLGNIRVTYTREPGSGIAVIMSENNYYPFGLLHRGYNNDELQYRSPDGIVKLYYRPSPEEDMINGIEKMPDNYKYNGKEWQDDLSLNMYDYGARNYDPAIGRYFTTDRMSEAFSNMNPYQYAADNPVKFIDVNGDYIYIYDKGVPYRYMEGKLYAQDKEGDWTEEFIAEQGSYAGGILQALNEIMQDDDNSFGSAFINMFNNGDINVSITENISPNKINAFQEGTVYTTFNKIETQTTAGLLISPFHITLAHELAHGLSYNVIKEEARAKVWLNVKLENGQNDPVKYDEIFASNFENMIRAEQGLPLRSHYVKNNGGEGSVYEQSRLIKKAKIQNPWHAVYEPSESATKIWNHLISNKK